MKLCLARAFCLAADRAQVRTFADRTRLATAFGTLRASNVDSAQRTGVKGAGNEGIGSRAVRVGTIVVVLCLALTAAASSSAAVGDLDPAFGVDGKVVTDLGAANFIASRVTLDGAGRIIVAAQVQPSDGSLLRLVVLRYLPNGALDTSFRDFEIPDARSAGVVAQPDGRIVLVAADSSSSRATVYRLTEDGALDTSFSGDGRFDEVEGLATAVVLQSDGKVVVGGLHIAFACGDPSNPATCGTSEDFLVFRLETDGTLDPTFGDHGIASVDYHVGRDQLTELALQPDGKIVAGGLSTPRSPGWLA
jgi:uncharacterized delta-60 repeat protein